MKTPTEFLTALWPDGPPGYLCLWTKSGDDKKSYWFDNVEDCGAQALRCNGHDVYVNMAVAATAGNSGTRVKSEDAVAIPGVWADLDVAGPGHKGEGLFESREEALAFLRGLPLKPSIIVWSGNGIHSHWLMKESVERGDKIEMSALTVGWENYLKSRTSRHLDTVSDLARVLRVPGTLNHKGGRGVPVKVIYSSDTRYNPDDFKDYLIEDPKLPIKHSLTGDSVADALLNYKAPMALTAAEVEAELFKLGERWYDGGYQDWRDVMFCLHHQSGGAEWGLKLFDQWSRQAGDRYCGNAKIKGLWKAIKGYERNGLILTWASVRKWIANSETVATVASAVEASDKTTEQFLDELGRCGSKAEIIKLIGSTRIDAQSVWELEKPVQKKIKNITGSTPPIKVIREWFRLTATTPASLPEWAKGWVYLRQPQRFYHLETREACSKEAFNISAQKYCVDDLPSAILSKSEGLKTYWNAIYLPGAPSEFYFEKKPCINLFNGWPDLKVDESRREKVWEMVLSHARSRYPTKWWVLIDYLAWCYQHPGKKVLWMPVLQGVQGDGKSYWAKMMTAVMGIENVSEIRTEEIRSNFTDWAHGSAFGYIEELRISGENRFETVDKLKPYITNSRVRIIPKGERGFDIPNVTNYIALTNYKDAVPVDSRDRRFLPFFSEYQVKDKLEPLEYFDELYEETLYKDGGGIIAEELKKWKVSKEFTVNRIPEIAGDTDKEEMIDLNKSDLHLAVQDYIDLNLGPIVPKAVKDKISSAFFDGGVKCTTAQVKRELLSLGYQIGEKRVTLNGRRFRPWIKIDGGAPLAF